MTKSPREVVLMLSVALVIAPIFVGCDGSGDAQSNASPAPGGPEQGGRPGRSSEIRQIMGKLAKGPTSLTPVIGGELKQDPPPWETIQGQAKEYAVLASELGKHDPPKGSKESWAKLTSDYAGSAGDLDKAAQQMDKAAALVAHDQLSNACNACHREHRAMGPGMGGPPGGFPGGPRPGGFRGGPPPGGPPPGGFPGPGGPPPGGPQAGAPDGPPPGGSAPR
jgi:hypothetical protein